MQQKEELTSAEVNEILIKLELEEEKIRKNNNKAQYTLFLIYILVSVLGGWLLSLLFKTPQVIAYSLIFHFYLIRDADVLANFDAFCFGISLLIASLPLLYWFLYALSRCKEKAIKNLYLTQNLEIEEIPISKFKFWCNKFMALMFLLGIIYYSIFFFCIAYILLFLVRKFPHKKELAN